LSLNSRAKALGGVKVSSADTYRAWQHVADFTPDGKLVATVRDGGVELRNTESGAVDRQVEQADPFGPVGQLAFNSDGSLLATVGGGPIPLDLVRIWNVKTGAMVQDCKWAFYPRSPIFSPNSDWLVIGGLSWNGRHLMPPTFRDDGDGAGVWSVKTGRQLFGVRRSTEANLTLLPAMAISSDGKRLVVGAKGEKTVIVYDLNR